MPSTVNYITYLIQKWNSKQALHSYRLGLQNIIREKWYIMSMIRQSEKLCCSEKSTYSRSGKIEWKTNSSHFLLIRWHSGVGCIWATTQMMKTLANVVLWCVTLFCLYHS